MLVQYKRLSKGFIIHKCLLYSSKDAKKIFAHTTEIPHGGSFLYIKYFPSLKLYVKIKVYLFIKTEIKEGVDKDFKKSNRKLNIYNFLIENIKIY